MSFACCMTNNSVPQGQEIIAEDSKPTEQPQYDFKEMDAALEENYMPDAKTYGADFTKLRSSSTILMEELARAESAGTLQPTNKSAGSLPPTGSLASTNKDMGTATSGVPSASYKSAAGSLPPTGSLASTNKALAPAPHKGPDFHGLWVADPNVPDGFDRFAELSGVPTHMIEASKARLLEFSPQLEISFDGAKCLTVVPTQAGGSQTQEFIVDGPAFNTTFGPRKKVGMGSAYWDGDALVLKIELDEGGWAEVRRFVADNELKETITIQVNGGEEASLYRAYLRKVTYE